MSDILSAIQAAAALDGRIDATVAAATAITADLAAAESAYQVLIARAAHGDRPPETEWQTVETEIERRRRQLIRLRDILHYLGAAVSAQTADLPLARAVPAGSA